MAWVVLRVVFAVLGLVLLAIAATTLFGWFTVDYNGNEIAWYWFLAGGFVLGLIGMVGDKIVGSD